MRILGLCWKCFKLLPQAEKKPVVAHPERYYFVQDDLRYALEWAEAGYSLQINTGSLRGYFGEIAGEPLSNF